MSDVELCPHHERLVRIENDLHELREDGARTRRDVGEIKSAVIGDVRDVNKPSMVSRLRDLESAEKRRSWIVRTFAGATLVLAATQAWNWITGSRP